MLRANLNLFTYFEIDSGYPYFIARRDQNNLENIVPVSNILVLYFWQEHVAKNCYLKHSISIIVLIVLFVIFLLSLKHVLVYFLVQ